MTESQLKDFERYAYIVPMKIKKLAPELADNEDFVQEVYTQLIEYLSNNEGYANLTEWHLKGIYVHKAVQCAILKERERLQSESLSNIDCVAVVYDLDRPMLSDAVESVLKTLPDKAKEILIEKYFLDMSYFEIANVHSMSIGSVRNIICKILKMIRRSSVADKLRDFYV